MSSLPALQTNQRLVGFAKPEWMVSPIPYTPRLFLDTTVDPLVTFDPKDVPTHLANTAFQTLLDKLWEINQTAKEYIGKQGLSWEQHQEHFLFDYLRQLDPQQLRDIVWNARVSPRYQLMKELYENLPDKTTPLATMTAEQLEQFSSINSFLAISIIIDITDELGKLKKQKKKLPPEQILESILQHHGIARENLAALFALAKKSPSFIKVSPQLRPLKLQLGQK